MGGSRCPQADEPGHRERLNHNIIAMTHKDYLDVINLEDVLNCYTSRTDIRKIMFGINKF